MFIPPNGLSCSSTSNDQDFFYVEIVKGNEKELKFNILSSVNNYLNIRVGDLTDDLEELGTVDIDKNSYNHYRTIITVDDISDMRLLGRTLEVLRNGK